MSRKRSLADDEDAPRKRRPDFDYQAALSAAECFFSSDNIYVDKASFGASCTLFRAASAVAQQQIAVKVLKPSATDDACALTEQFLHTRVNGHPHIVHFLGYQKIALTRHSSRNCLLFEWTDLKTVDDASRHCPKFLACNARRWSRQLLLALRHCHSLGVLHLDIKPANLLVSRDNADFNIKLTDLGIGEQCQLDDTGMPKSIALQHVVTTLWQRPPEELLKTCFPVHASRLGVSAASDMWAAGITIGQMHGALSRLCTASNEITQLAHVLALSKCKDRDAWPQAAAALSIYARIRSDGRLFCELGGAAADFKIVAQEGWPHLPRKQRAKAFWPRLEGVERPEEVQCLLRRILRLAPPLRLSARGALHHEYFCDTAQC